MSANLAVARSALKLGFFISSLTAASLGARLATADISPATPSRIFGLAAEGRLSIARRDLGLKPPATADLLTGGELNGDARRLSQTAAVPALPDPTPPARPFVFHGGAGDRAAALTCLTQAVYYEAGFEPIGGAQAVAQVVLNRVRHPIFPKSICGVVYQGAELKTGCQFSFTCDGSLAKTPAKGAWDRAKAVATQAMNGFVQKDVGEATHYHTRWVNPWWAPTVTRIAQVGVQIFYRWPGALGSPAAFVGRYAGGEHVGRGAILAPGVQTTGADGRVHVILTAGPTAAPAIMSKAEAMASMELASARTPAPSTALTPGGAAADDAGASRR